MSGYLTMWKLKNGLFEKDFYDDALCDLFMEIKRVWRNQPKLTEWQAKQLFGMLPPPEAVRGRLDRNAVMEKVDMQQLIEMYIPPPYRVMGDRLTVICPFHSEKTPSMSINLSKKRYHCFGSCGEGGSAIDLIMKSEGINFLAALKKLNELF